MRAALLLSCAPLCFCHARCLAFVMRAALLLSCVLPFFCHARRLLLTRAALRVLLSTGLQNHRGRTTSRGS